MIRTILRISVLTLGLLAFATPINAGECSGGGWNVECSGGICVACVSDGLGYNWCGNVSEATAQYICAMVLTQ